MAMYVKVPRDLSRVKSKVIFNLTRRQIVCFGSAALVGLPVFFLVRKTGNISIASVCMMVVMLPLFFLALYEKNGQPLEVIVKYFVQTKFIRPKVRPYKTSNYYELLRKQRIAEEEVNHIVSDFQKNKTRKNKTAGRIIKK